MGGPDHGRVAFEVVPAIAAAHGVSAIAAAVSESDAAHACSGARMAAPAEFSPS